MGFLEREMRASWTKITVIDSRGAAQSINEWPNEADLSHERREAAAKHLHQLLSGDRSPLAFHVRIIFVMATVVALLVILVTWAFQFQWARWNSWVQSVVIVVGIGLTTRYIFEKRAKRHAAELQEIACKFGVCIRCGYDLEGLPIAEDGCRECPECGAAWGAGRISS